MRESVFFIAEAGVNHNGSLEKALALIDLAAKAGADAVKFQTFKADLLTTDRAETCDYQAAALAGQKTQKEMLRDLELSEDQFLILAAHAKACDIEFMSTAFDPDSLDFLINKCGIKRVKIPSGEMLNPFLLLGAARSGLPVILSTGMASLEDVEQALALLAFGYVEADGYPSLEAAKTAFSTETAQQKLSDLVTILHCTTEYPAPVAEVNLRAMQSLAESFGLKIGFSDHTEGIHISLAAVALGATVIEKHFTLDKTLAGPDHKSSLSPQELKDLGHQIREVSLSLGNVEKRAGQAESRNKVAARGSLVAAVDLARGEIFSAQNLAVKRPGDGVSPIFLGQLIGKAALCDYVKDEQIEAKEID